MMKKANVFGLGIVTIIACSAIMLSACSKVDQSKNSETATTAITTTTTEMEAIQTTTVTEEEDPKSLIDRLPSYRYKQAEITTESVVVRASDETVFDYLQKGQIFFISGSNYGGMMEVYYERDNMLYHGWILDNKDWYSTIL